MSEMFRAAAALHSAGKLEAAEAAYRRVIAAENDWQAAYNLGVLLSGAGRLDEAIAQWALARALNPRHVATLSALGNAHLKLQRAEEAERWLRAAAELAPADHRIAYRLCLALLAQGRLAEAWPLYERRPSRVETGLARTRLAEWRGEDLTGRSLLVWGEQGLGDEIQFGRFVPRLRDLGARRLDVAVSPENLRLFGQLAPDQVLDRTGPVDLSRYDAWVLLGSLPLRLGVGPADIQGDAYLRAEPRGSTARLGLMTGANPKGENGAAKTLPPGQAERLRALGAVDLSPAATGAGDLQDTAEILAGLDLVITVDTAVAHLAGAMGRPAWILLPFVGVDWRWGRGVAATPWYASVRLFRQPAPGDWHAVVDEVCALLSPGGPDRARSLA